MENSELKRCISLMIEQGLVPWISPEERMSQLMDSKEKVTALLASNAFKTLLRFAKAIDNPKRLEMLSLIQNGIFCPCELEYIMNLSQATVSRHLNLLEEGGLIDRKREGKWSFINLKHTEFRKILLGL